MAERQLWCRFRDGAGVSFGRIEGGEIAALDGAPWDSPRATGRRVPLAGAKLEVPVIPGTFYCAGINYRGHVIKMAAKRGAVPQFPDKADIGYRANNALCAHDEPIVKPKAAGEEFQYEGELVAVFGKRARGVSKAEALDCVFGWTIGNDVSERHWQRADRTLWRAKNCDSFKPMGPWIASGVDPTKMETVVRMNGRETDRFATWDMIFDPPTFIAEVSRYITILPGDVMWFGTDGLPQNMAPGDVCEIEIAGIGTLRNPIVAER